MPDTLRTLADMVTLNDMNLVDAGASDVFNDAPVLARLHAIPASNGTNHKYLKESAAPVVGFRAINSGRDHSVSGDVLVEIALKLLDFTHKTDKALADAYARGGAEAYLTRETGRHLRAALQLFERAIFYGTAVDAGAFTGLIAAAPIATLAGGMVVNATGAAARTSVYMLRTTTDERNVCAIAGNDGRFDIGDAFTQLVTDGTGKQFPAYVVPSQGWLGVQVGSVKSIARIANIGTAANTTLTDAMLSQCFELFPEEAPPNLIVMNARSRGQLQRSRTVYSPTGAEAPLPQEWNGIPIVATGSISNAETAVA